MSLKDKIKWFKTKEYCLNKDFKERKSIDFSIPIVLKEDVDKATENFKIKVNKYAPTANSKLNKYIRLQIFEYLNQELGEKKMNKKDKIFILKMELDTVEKSIKAIHKLIYELEMKQ